MAGRGFAAAGLMCSRAASAAAATASSSSSSSLRGSRACRVSAVRRQSSDAAPIVRPLPPASAEQSEVVASVLARVNIACEAVAGSGKTTTILHCAEAAPSLKFLLLTYNARLKVQTRQRARQLGLSNLEVHSFHAMGARYYDRTCRNDEVLRALVDGDKAPHSAIAFDCLVIDEAQDLTPLLHRFVLKYWVKVKKRSLEKRMCSPPYVEVLRDRRRIEAVWRGGSGDGGDDGGSTDDATSPPSLLVLGDSRQGIYQFRDADCRFLSMADWGLYNLAPEADLGGEAAAAAATAASAAAATDGMAWRHHTLRTSFRATPNIASFVNDAMLGFPCIHALPRQAAADPAGAPVTYLVGNSFTVANQELVDEIECLLQMERYSPEDIFVLTPSLKGAKLNSKTPLTQLENTLVMRLNVPVYVSNSEEEEVTDDLIQGKLCVTTFHSSKGLERPVVIVFGFSANYFRYFARDASPAVCPNPLYVAVTRASERLYLVAEDTEGGRLPFLRIDPEACAARGVRLPPWVRVRRCGKLRPDPVAEPVPASKFAVTDVVKFLPDKVMSDMVATLRPEVTCEPEHDAAIDAFVPSLAGKGLIESVSDITGLAVVAAHEHKHRRTSGDRGGGGGGGDGGWSEWDGGGKGSTSLARRLSKSLYKMEKQLEANASVREARRGGQPSKAASKIDYDVDDVEAVRCMREVLSNDPSHVRDFLRLASWYGAMEGGYLFRPFQLSHFDWVSSEAAVTCATILEKHLPAEDDDEDEGKRRVPVRYEREYDVSFRVGAIVTIRGFADAVTAAGDVGEIFEVKCVQRLLPEHFLQLACYKWLAAMERVQQRVAEHNKRRERKQEEEGSGGDGVGAAAAAAMSGGHRGFKGSGKKRREYTLEEAMGPTALLDAFARAGGDEASVMKRAVLLNARTGEAIELRADLRALTAAVLTMVEHRLRSTVTVPDDVFLKACAAAGAVLHPPAGSAGGVAEGGSPLANILSSAAAAAAAAEAGAGAASVRTRAEAGLFAAPAAGGGGGGGGGSRSVGRGVVKKRRQPPAKRDSKGGASTSDSDAKSESESGAHTEAGVVAAAERKYSYSGGGGVGTTSVSVGGTERQADVRRKVLLGGDAPRPRGRAPAARPWWDSVAAVFVPVD